jgi:hypothetical protein
MDYKNIKQVAEKRRDTLEERRGAIDKQLLELHAEKQKIQRELAGLDEMLESIEFVINPDIPPDLESVGLTDQVRAIYQGSTAPLTPVEVRDLLLQSGVSASSAKNLLISVHTVISRELERETMKPVDRNGKPAYEWQGPRRFARTEAREAKRRAFIGQSLGASRSLSRTSDELLKAQIESAKGKG